MFSVDYAQVSIEKKEHQVVFASLLQCLDGTNLEVQVICPVCLGNLVHQACKRSLADEEFSAPLIPMYLIESHNPQLVPLGPLQPTLPKFFAVGLPTYGGSDMAQLSPGQ